MGDSTQINIVKLPLSDNKASIFLPIRVNQNTSRNIPITALLDSGAQGNFISPKFTEKCEFQTQKIAHPIKVSNADGTPNESGSIYESVQLNALIDGKQCQIEAYVTGIGSKDLILGYPWLQQNNPDIDWTKQEFKWRNHDSIVPLIAKSTGNPMAINEIALDLYGMDPHEKYTYLDDLDPLAVNLFETLTQTEEPDLSIDELRLYLENVDFDEFSIEDELYGINTSPHELEINAKIASSATLAQKHSPKSDTKLPDKYKKFASLFDAKKSERYPPSRPYDHKIELLDTFKPELGKTYPLSPKETEELQKVHR